MSEPLKDWRADGTVVAATAERDAAAGRVRLLEAEHRELMVTVRAAAQAVDAAEAQLQRSEISLAALSRSKAALSAARAAASEVEHQAEDAYKRLSDCEEQLRVVSEAAQRKCWAGNVQQYKAAVKRLAEVMETAMAAELEVCNIHRTLTEIYPRSADGWIVGPDAEQRLAFGGFGKARRLVPVSHASWLGWITENILDAAEPAVQLRKRAQAVGDALRALAGA